MSLKDRVGQAMMEAHDDGFVFSDITVDDIADAMIDTEPFKFDKAVDLIPHIEMWLATQGLVCKT